jgi:uncharacterized peroxidase-related enzyme
MPYINLEQHLPGVTGLLEFSPNTSEPLRGLTQFLLRGPSSLTEAEREWIATLVSHRNKCVYCATSHAAAADAFLGEHDTTTKIRSDHTQAPISEKMKALLTIASQVQESGTSVTQAAVNLAKEAGATDLEIHDTVLIAALFCLYNRYVDGLATVAPSDPTYYAEMAERLKTSGYYRPAEGYDHLKKK